MSKAYPSDLTRDQFELIAAKLPADSSRGRLRTTSYWAILNTIFYVLCEGCTWRGLPRRLSSLANGLHLLPPLEPRRHLASDS
jgi:transposase